MVSVVAEALETRAPGRYSTRLGSWLLRGELGKKPTLCAVDMDPACVNDVFDEKGFALTLECPFTFSPASHFAVHVGPTFDVDMLGSRDPSPVDKGDRTYRTFGLNVGLLGWF